MHCWEDGPITVNDDLTETGSTCMLEDGHEGPHEFVLDSEITIKFNTEAA